MDYMNYLKNFEFQVFIIILFFVIIGIVIWAVVKYRKPILSAISLYNSLEEIKNGQSKIDSNINLLMDQHNNITKQVAQIAAETIPNGVNTIRKTNDTIFEIRDSINMVAVKLDARIEIDKACLFECDKQGMYVSANSALCNLFGGTQDQLLGLGWGKFIHKDDTDVALANWERAVKSKQHELVDSFRINTREGIRLIEYKAVLKFDTKGDIKAIFGTAWEKKTKNRDSENIECIANMAREIKGTRLWNEIENEIKLKTKK